MSLKDWENKVLARPGARARVEEIEHELRLAAGLTALRERAGLSQRELAERLGVSQPRVAAIERSRNVTVDVLGQYVEAVGGTLELTVRAGNRRISLLPSPAPAPRPRTSPAAAKKTPAKKTTAVTARKSAPTTAKVTPARVSPAKTTAKTTAARAALPRRKPAVKAS